MEVASRGPSTIATTGSTLKSRSDVTNEENEIGTNESSNDERAPFLSLPGGRPLENPGRSRKLGSLTIDTVVDVASAKKFRELYLGDKPLSLALFPASCSPPTKQHMEIARVVSALPYVDEVWVDVNYQSFTKDTLEKTYLHRLLMVQKEISSIPNTDTCILSKNMELVDPGDTQEIRLEKTRNYWKVARILCGDGKLSWVMGGDVFRNMVYWKKIGLIGLEAVDKLVVFSRTLSEETLKGITKQLWEDENRALQYWEERIHFVMTGDISSSKAREALTTLLSTISLGTLAHLTANPKVLKEMVGWEEPDSEEDPLFSTRGESAKPRQAGFQLPPPSEPDA